MNNLFSFRDSLPNLKTNIRFLHAAAGAPAIDIYVNGDLVARNISFSDVTNYSAIAPGRSKVEFFKTGTYDAPISDESFDLLPNSTLTISIILEESSLVTFRWIKEKRVFSY